MISSLGFIHNLLELITDAIYSSSSTSPNLYQEFIYHTTIGNKAYGFYEIYNNGIARGEVHLFRV